MNNSLLENSAESLGKRKIRYLLCEMHHIFSYTLTKIYLFSQQCIKKIEECCHYPSSIHRDTHTFSCELETLSAQCLHFSKETFNKVSSLAAKLWQNPLRTYENLFLDLILPIAKAQHFKQCCKTFEKNPQRVHWIKRYQQDMLGLASLNYALNSNFQHSLYFNKLFETIHLLFSNISAMKNWSKEIKEQLNTIKLRILEDLEKSLQNESLLKDGCCRGISLTLVRKLLFTSRNFKEVWIQLHFYQNMIIFNQLNQNVGSLSHILSFLKEPSESELQEIHHIFYKIVLGQIPEEMNMRITTTIFHQTPFLEISNAKSFLEEPTRNSLNIRRCYEVDLTDHAIFLLMDESESHYVLCDPNYIGGLLFKDKSSLVQATLELCQTYSQSPIKKIIRFSHKEADSSTK